MFHSSESSGVRPGNLKGVRGGDLVGKAREKRLGGSANRQRVPGPHNITTYQIILIICGQRECRRHEGRAGFRSAG
jgi:hypothetical protein